jgi:L,D-peptidoglycan transpeptidase YkuD (ErfK/YbiS/YcfS/YnhG family)
MREVTVPADAAAPALRSSALTPVPPPPTPTAAPDQRSAPGRTVAKRDAARSTGDKAGSTGTTSSPAQRCVVPAGVRASQVVVVRSSGTRATVRACSRASNGTYRTELGPYSGYVGRSGVTSAASKREGDGATPAGVYPLRGGFGLKGNPGIPQGWFRVDSRDVWVDDPNSTLYNTHQRKPADGRWSSAESLANPPAYDYAQVIGYNESRRPGRGSAIFLHVSTGGPTAGCVSLPRSSLLGVMRWERSGAVIAIS